LRRVAFRLAGGCQNGRSLPRSPPLQPSPATLDSRRDPYLSDSRVGPPRADARSVFRIKAWAVVVIAASFWPLRWFAARDIRAAEGTLTIVADLIPTLAVLRWRQAPPRWLLSLTFAVDIVAITVGVHYAGGVDSSSIPILYPIIISMAGLLLSEAAGYVVAAASSLLYGGLVLAEGRGWLAHVVPYGRPPGRQLTTVVLTTQFFFLFAVLVSFVARELRRSYERAEELRTEAVTALSHDLRTPLGVIRGYATMLLDAPASDREALARRIERHSSQALDLVQNVLDASALEWRPMVAERAPLDVNALVREVRELYDAAAGAKGVQLSAREGRGTPSIEADARLLLRALGNLVSNAIKFTPAAGSVEISTSHDPRGLAIEVRDSGPGIPEAEQGRLFRKYSRVSSGVGVEGTGLGLYIVRSIAEAHGGSVEVVSCAGEGCSFVIRLPVRAPAAS
jgi:signal transduction histidine kinase